MILLKVADISNEVRPLEVAEPWIECLLEEFFQQVGGEQVVLPTSTVVLPTSTNMLLATLLTLILPRNLVLKNVVYSIRLMHIYKCT